MRHRELTEDCNERANGGSYYSDTSAMEHEVGQSAMVNSLSQLTDLLICTPDRYDNRAYSLDLVPVFYSFIFFLLICRNTVLLGLSTIVAKVLYS